MSLLEVLVAHQKAVKADLFLLGMNQVEVLQYCPVEMQEQIAVGYWLCGS